MFEQSTFLYANEIRGDLPGLGVAEPVGVSISAYSFASLSLVLVSVGFLAAIYGSLGKGSRVRASRILSAGLFLSAPLVFVIGLSSAVSQEGRRIWMSETLGSSGSIVTSGLASGFYLVIVASAILGFSFLMERSAVKIEKA